MSGLAMAKKMGADMVLDYRKVDVVEEIKKLTGGGVDVAIEALFERTGFCEAWMTPERRPLLGGNRNRPVKQKVFKGLGRRLSELP